MAQSGAARGEGWHVKPFTAAAALLALVVLLASSVGSVNIPPAEIAGAVWRGLTGGAANTHDVIVWRVRMPRVLSAALVGGALAMSGAAYQGVFRNPLAEPYLLGVASGAGFGAALGIAFAGNTPLGVSALSFLGALVGVAAVVTLARRGAKLPIVSLILAGVVLGSLASAATSYLMLLSQENAAATLAWLLGSFSLSSWPKLQLLFPVVLASAFVLQGFARALNLLQLGDDQAAQLGLNVELSKLILIVTATVMTAVAVSLAGVIGFAGLMVPHAVRLLLGPDYRKLMPMSLLLGGVFMVLADLAARSLLSPAELPVGVVTALTGAPFFLWLLRRTPR